MSDESMTIWICLGVLAVGLIAVTGCMYAMSRDISTLATAIRATADAVKAMDKTVRRLRDER